MTFRNTLDFLLLDWLQATRLAARPRFADHSADTFAAVLDLSERLAQDKFAPHNRLVEARGTISGQEVVIGDFRHLKTPAPFIAIMPQWDFLDFLRDEAGDRRIARGVSQYSAVDIRRIARRHSREIEAILAKL